MPGMTPSRPKRLNVQADGWHGGGVEDSWLGFGSGSGRLGLNVEVDDGEWEPGCHKRQNPGADDVP